MKDIAFVGQDQDHTMTIKDPDGGLVDLTGHTATVEYVKPDGTVISKTGVVDTGASTVTGSLVPADLVDADRGIWTYYPVLSSGGKTWPGKSNHFHLVAPG